MQETGGQVCHHHSSNCRHRPGHRSQAGAGRREADYLLPATGEDLHPSEQAA